MMTIRFQCQSCSQPIEVDEEWARKTVACPYCQATITAPAQSTLKDFEHIPTASPIIPTPTGSAHSPPATRVQPVPGRNKIAVVALVLAGLLIALRMIEAFVVAPHSMELVDMQEKIQASDKSTESQMKIFNELIDDYGGVLPGWLITYIMIQLIAIPTFLAAVICGFIGIRHPYRRSLAVISLAICTGIFLLTVTSVMLSM